MANGTVELGNIQIIAGLKGCCVSKDLELGKALHLIAASFGADLNVRVASTLVNMYAKCGKALDAHKVFEKMCFHTVVSWTILISGYVENGQGETALEIFLRMDCEPDALTYVAALKACTCIASRELPKEVNGRLLKVDSLLRGKAIHSRYTKCEKVLNIRVGNTLIDFYGKCGDLESAQRVFDNMTHLSVVSWNALMFGYAEHGDPERTIKLLSNMLFQGFAPDVLTYISALKSCSSVADEQLRLENGMCIHSYLVKSKFDMTFELGSSLIDMYCKAGSLVDARVVFDGISHRDVVIWNVVILGYAENGESRIAIDMYNTMRHDGFKPDSATYVAALKACIGLGADEGKIEGIVIHFHSIKSGVDSNVYVANSLIDMYSKCRSMLDARKVFNNMQVPTLIAWNAMLFGYVGNEDGRMALELFEKMIQTKQTAPDALTYVAALKACTTLAAREEWTEAEGRLLKWKSRARGMSLHSQAKDFCFDARVQNTVIDMYAKCGCMFEAQNFFDELKERSLVAWTALVAGYADNGQPYKALELFLQMKNEGFSPDNMALGVALKACGTLGALEAAKSIHLDISNSGHTNDILLMCCLIDCYGKCGNMVEAHHVFNLLSVKNVLAWSNLMLGYSRQSKSEVVFDLFQKMCESKVKPDAVVLLCVLTACNHSGLVNRGKQYFADMTPKYGVHPDIEHYNCMIDILSRANELDAAVSIAQSMPFKANTVTWTTILGGSRKWKNPGFERTALDSLMRLNDKDSGAYVLLANIYSTY